MFKEGLEFLVGKLSVDTLPIENDRAMLMHGSAKVVDLEKFKNKPFRITENMEFPNIEGFAAYLKDYATDKTKLFANINSRFVTAVIDYHGKNDPSFCAHEAIIKFQLDKDFTAWLNVDGRTMNQSELVNFLLDYADDFVTPNKAEVLEMVGSLKASKKSDMDSSVGHYDINKIINNSVSVKSSKGKLPDIFTLKLPILEGFDKYGVSFRFGIRFENDDLRFTIKLIRPHNIEKLAFNDACSEIVKSSKREIYGFEKASVTETEESK